MCAQDIMTSPAITFAPDASAADIANLLESRGIQRVPILRDGHLIGLVSRANPIQALAAERRSRTSGRTDRGRLAAHAPVQPHKRTAGGAWPAPRQQRRRRGIAPVNGAERRARGVHVNPSGERS